MLLASYGNLDGTRIWPGVDRLVLVTCASRSTVLRQLTTLRDAGLIERVRRGDRARGHADEYRLTVPVDVLDRVWLTPDEEPP